MMANIKDVLSADDTVVGPACSFVDVPETIVMDLNFREPYIQGYRHALSDVRKHLKTLEPPLLQCVDCRNTESPAGAMTRFFNRGRCLHCGGYFKVVRA